MPEAKLDEARDGHAPPGDALRAGWSVRTPPQPVQADREPLLIPWIGVPVPAVVQDAASGLGERAHALRQSVLTFAPALIVNNASNLIGVTHLTGETMMLKSNGTRMLAGKPRDQVKGLDYIWLPFKNVLNTAKFGFALEDLGRGDFWKQSLENLTSYEKASRADAAGGAKLLNRWAGRSTLMGITGMTMVALMPDDTEDPRDVERMTALYNRSPAGYVAARIGQALNPMEWPEHKRHFTGLAMMLTGVASFLAGFRNVKNLEPAVAAASGLAQKYFFNGWHTAGGVLTAAGGSALILGLDEEQGWKNYGKITAARIFTMPANVAKRLKEGEQGALWYMGAQGVFTGMGAMAYLLGGAEKDEKGNLIDKKALREAAQRKFEAGEINGHAPKASLTAPAKHDGKVESPEAIREAV